MIAQRVLRAGQAGVAGTWPLLVAGIGLAGLYRAAQALGELLVVLESSGAVGGGPGPGQQRRG